MAKTSYAIGVDFGRGGNDVIKRLKALKAEVLKGEWLCY